MGIEKLANLAKRLDSLNDIRARARVLARIERGAAHHNGTTGKRGKMQ